MGMEGMRNNKKLGEGFGKDEMDGKCNRQEFC
jgi:hypothetical protein